MIFKQKEGDERTKQTQRFPVEKKSPAAATAPPGETPDEEQPTPEPAQKNAPPRKPDK